MLDVCDPETRKNCATLKESLMDVDSNFEEDYNSINALKRKINKKKPEVQSKKKKVTFDLADDISSNENAFDYEYDDDASDEVMTDDEHEDENDVFDEEMTDENMSDEEHLDSNNEEEFDYDHEEEFDYEHEEEKESSDESCFDEEHDESLSDNGNDDTNNKIVKMKEDIYGRIRKSDGTIAVNYLLL